MLVTESGGTHQIDIRSKMRGAGFSDFGRSAWVTDGRRREAATTAWMALEVAGWSLESSSSSAR